MKEWKMNIVWMAVLAATCALSACQMAAIRDQPPGQLYVFQSDSQGFDTKNFFYDSGKEVIVFDAQFTRTYAQQSIDFIRSKTQSPIKYLVITHPNPDKFNGLQAFQDAGAKVIASRQTVAAMPGVHAYKKSYFVNVAKSFTDATYPSLGKVDIVFDGHYEIKLGTGEVLQVTELGSAGVSTNQTVAYLPLLKTFLVGDLIHYKAHAWLEGGIVNGKPVPALLVWQQTLDALRKLSTDEEAMVYGGRGEKAPLAIAIEAQKEYLTKADAIVKEYIRGLADNKSELGSDKAGEHYKAIQAKFEQAFPGYGLGYMIQYGVYGLVNASL